MAGRPIIRSSNLVFITTTSLYGKRPNQYDRLRISCNDLIEGNNNIIEYKYLGETEGIGTFHFGDKTVHVIRVAD